MEMADSILLHNLDVLKDDLKREYEENHDIYAEEIVRHMIEV